MSATRIVVTPEIPGAEAPSTVSGKPAAEKPQVEGQNNPQETPKTQPNERPAWLPEKFKTPEDMATAYAELEKKQSQQPPKKEGEEAPAEVKQPEQVQGFDKFSKEYADTGKLSEESYTALAKQGITKAHVDAYIRGIEADKTAAETAVYDAVGGKEAYAEATQWAAQNLPAEDVAAYNEVLQSGNAKQIALAARGLVAQHKAAVGTEGTRVRGSVAGSGSVTPFKSSTEVTTAMSDPRYSTDEAYRNEVAERLRFSNVL